MLYGLYKANPLEFNSYFLRQKMSWSLFLEKKLPQPIKKSVVGFCSLPVFISLKSKIDANHYLIFDSYDTIVRLESLTILEHTNPEKVKDLINNAKPGTDNLKLNPDTALQDIFKTIKSDHFLHNYNTFLYRIHKRIRGNIQTAVLNYMCGLSTLQQFDLIVQKSLNERVTMTPITHIQELVKSPYGVELREQVNFALKGHSVDKLEEKSQVSGYEIRYLLAYHKKRTGI